MAQDTKQRRIILGLMTVGPEKDKGARITSLDEFNDCLDLFQKRGYHEVDTARLYVGGKQEAFSKDARWKERGLSMATKWYPMGQGSHRAEIVKAKCEESLRELGTDSVDIFYLHAPDRSTPFAETFKALDDLHRQGKFKRLGLSNFSAFEVAEVVTLCNERGWVRPTIYQGIYNAITRGIEGELIPCCRRYGIDVVIFNPLAGGFLAGKYKSSDTPAEGRFSDKSSLQGQMYRSRYFKDTKFQALDILTPVVEKHNLTMASVALRWVVHHSDLKILDGNDGIITGFSSLDQLGRNLDDLEGGPLPDEVVKALDDSWFICKQDTDNFWHGKLEYGYNTNKELFKD
ncbi:aflatoxin B1 aldehyde reductase member 2 [Ilyonectria sp. MPI-CAGE-AT-0026]|nr:aflatoxin B1 aldehyde reductase member 2 [Ilyonectria sp. MPI-CAGE-AT-0026]